MIFENRNVSIHLYARTGSVGKRQKANAAVGLWASKPLRYNICFRAVAA